MNRYLKFFTYKEIKSSRVLSDPGIAFKVQEWSEYAGLVTSSKQYEFIRYIWRLTQERITPIDQDHLPADHAGRWTAEESH